MDYNFTVLIGNSGQLGVPYGMEQKIKAAIAKVMTDEAREGCEGEIRVKVADIANL